MAKKGLSDIITVVLIILIALVAIMLLWSLIRLTLTTTSKEIEIKSFNANFEVGAICITPDQNISVLVKRNQGEGNINGVYLVLKDNSGRAETFFRGANMQEFDSRWFFVDKSEYNLSLVSKVGVNPSIATSSGESKLGGTGTEVEYIQNNENCTTYGSLFQNNIIPPPRPNLNSPTNLVAAAPSSSYINLDWADNSNSEDGFAIERNSSLGVGWSNIINVSANINNYQDTGLINNVNYSYRVRAFIANNFSNYSNEASALTQDPYDPLSNGLIAYWKFNELSWSNPGDVIDNSGKNNHANPENGINVTQSGISNSRSGSFDGFDDFLSFPITSDFPAGNASITLSVWVYQNNLSHRNYVVGYGEGGSNREFRITLNQDSPGQFSIENCFNGWHSNTTLLQNQWYHLAVTYNGTLSPRFYVNGTEYPISGTWGFLPYVDLGGFGNGAIGGRGEACGGTSFGSLPFYEGLIDEVAIWNRSLTSQEITNLYSSNAAANYVPIMIFMADKTVNVGEPVVFHVNATDNDTQTLNYTVSGLPQGSKFTIVGDVDFNGSLSFNDSSLINQARAGSRPFNAMENYTCDFNFNNGCDDGDALVINQILTGLRTDPIVYNLYGYSGGSIFAPGKIYSQYAFTWIPQIPGVYPINFTVSDGEKSMSRIVTINVV